MATRYEWLILKLKGLINNPPEDSIKALKRILEDHENIPKWGYGASGEAGEAD